MGKVFKQDITLKGRASLGLGWYIPGAFAVYRTTLLRSEFKNLLKNNFVSQDFGLSLRLLTNKYDKCYFAPEVVATELEKSTFSGWLLQQTRWFMGYFGMCTLLSDLFSRAKAQIKVGIVGLFFIWNIFPYALFVGLIIGLICLFFNPTFLIAYAIAYIAATLIVLSLKDTRKYGLGHQLSYWFMTSLINSLAVPLSIYGFIFANYNEGELYTLFKR
jgi:cellulose synthase/poly-beta-1,6-N-acetylglucosamine synthase-like glycosyltransferase